MHGVVVLGLVVLFVPFGEVAEALPEGDLGSETVVAFEGGGVGVGRGDVAGLHGEELAVGFEVVIGWQYAGADEFFLEGLDEVQ